MPSTKTIANLSVQIVRFVDSHQPGWVACEFSDSMGRRHTVIDKAPIFSAEDLRKDSAYPRPGKMPCEILLRWKDASGNELAHITIASPLDDKSEEGLSEFVVHETLLSDQQSDV